MFSKKFWITTLEVTVAAGGSAFAGTLVLTTTPSWKGVLASAVAAGVAAIYAFAKQLGSVQALNALKQSNPPITRP